MNEMINASTVLVSMLTIQDKNSLYYNLSIFSFGVIATVNHVLPENLDGLTHLVKMMFSNVLFSLIGLNPFLAFALSFIDLIPMFTKHKTIKFLGESCLQLPRLSIEIYLIYSLYHSNFYHFILMMVCKVIYFFERRARIKKGIRNDFSSWHAAEHIGLYLLFKDLTGTEFSMNAYLVILVLLVISVWMFFHLLNVFLHLNHLSRAPEWVKNSEQLKTILQEKLEKNRRSLKWHNYIIKPWTSHLKLEFVTWKAIERICDVIIANNIKRDNFDMVIGISTGGSFVGKYISHKLNLPFVIIQSKLWSDISFKQNFLQTYYYVLGKEQKPNIGQIPQVEGKRILLVDDTTFTGITLNGNKNVLLGEGKATSVETMVMWMKGPHMPNYFYSNKRIPILWEWGVEVD